MKKILYALFVISVFLVGCSNLEHDYSEVVNLKEMSYEENNIINNVESKFESKMQFPKNAIVSGDATFLTESGEIKLKDLSKIELINEDENYYEAICDDISGKIKKEDVMFFNLDTDSKYTLMLDVSEFNNDNNFYSFQTHSELGRFIIQNKINYLYIRICGRGYGQKGILYTDSKTEFFTNACDYFGIPYGFYFIDEALNEEEAIEEVEFVKKCINGKNFEMNKLPIAIDVEYSYGKSRADNIWDKRTPVINKLISEFANLGYDCILYANGARIDTYIKDVNCHFWTAMYPRRNCIPSSFYDDMVKQEQNKIKSNPEYLSDSFLSIDINMADTGKTEYTDEYLSKVKAWQFTENGAKEDGIDGLIDLSLVDNYWFLDSGRLRDVH